MDYRDSAVIYKKELIEDGLGGYTTKDVGIKEIKCKVAPFTISEIDSAGRLATYSKINCLHKKSWINYWILMKIFIFYMEINVIKKNQLLTTINAT